MFWCKTISGNDFTPYCVFGCAWKIKFYGKAFPLTVCFMALTWKLVYIFIFTTNHFRVSDAQRERERERERERVTDPPKIDRTLAPAPPSRSHHHRDRTPPRLHHHWRLIRPKPISLALLLPMANLITLSISSLPMIDLVSISSLPMTDLVSISSPMTDLVAHDPWPISPFPSIFDHSLFLPLLVWPNCGV